MTGLLTILQFSDLHILTDPESTLSKVNTETSFKQLLQQAVKTHQQIDLLLITGDLAQHPYLSTYQRINNILDHYQIPTICLAGNHDNFTLMQQCFNNSKINCHKNKQFDHWQIISLNSQKINSQGGYLAQSELDYLSNQLEKNTSLNTLIAMHHHPIKINSPWMDTMMIENNAELFLLLEQYPQVKAIIFGHIHQEFEYKEQGIQLLGTPSSCFQFKPYSSQFSLDDNEAGYRYLKLYSNGKVTSKIYRANKIT